MECIRPFETNGENQTLQWDKALERILALEGTDPAYFVLAVHSLIEAWLNAQNFEWGYQDSLKDKPTPFTLKISDIVNRNNNLKDTLSCFSSSYTSTNQIRHFFAQVTPADALNCGKELFNFCNKAKFGSKEILSALETSLSKWQEVDSSELMIKKLRQQEQEFYKTLNLTQAQLDQRLQEINDQKNEQAKLQEQLERKDHELLLQADKTKEANERIDQIRSERFELQQKLQSFKKNAPDNAALQSYLAELQSVHQISRTNLEYQKSLMKLSEHQKEALNSFTPGQNFLVRGGAGTGKTLVLIQAIQKIRQQEKQLDFDLKKPRRVLMLTYTKTLIQYSQYLDQLIGQDHGADEICTVDSWLKRIAENILASTITIKFNSEDLSTTGLKLPEKEIFDEIENFIWARDLNFDEYVTNKIERTGRMHSVKPEFRKKAWEDSETLLQDMDNQKTYSHQGLARITLRKLKQKDLKQYQDFEVIAVDEVQDLCPISLKLISTLAKESVLMAGDTRQSLYQPGFTFSSLGIDIKNKTRILKENFRNTQQLEETAQRFLANTQCIYPDSDQTKASRSGLMPKLLIYKKASAPAAWAAPLLQALSYYRNVLKYEEESIAILYNGLNTQKDKDLLAKFLKDADYLTVNIRDHENWMEMKGIRVSTIYSAKGLDFPVVILLLPQVNYPNRDLYEQKIRYQQEASLVYVGMTRALENLTVIVPEDSKSTTMNALKSAFTG